MADQLITRLFDQRQFTNGEISYLVKGFEQEANLEANFDRILKINENVCVTLDKTSSDLLRIDDKPVEDVCDQGES